jgi:hypothetical protein
MRAQRIALGLFAALLVTGCDDPLGVLGSLRLRDAKSRWEQRGFRDYSFEFRASCFCASLYHQWCRVDVRADVVAAVFVIAESSFVSASERADWPTIDRLFGWIENPSVYERITAIYDAQFGYPRSIILEAPPGVYDAGGTYETRALTAAR